VEPRTVIVARCPRCGSTDAGSDESRSVIEFTYMRCCACGHGELVDSYERDEDWLVEIALPEGTTEIPPFVAPLAPRAASKVSTPVDRDATPSKDAAPGAAPPELLGLSGCASCCRADAAVAWTTLSSRRVANLLEESHFSISLSRCICGQHFAIVFLERIDWVGGEDDQTWLVVPLRDAEVRALRACEESALEGQLHELARGRRFLGRYFPTQGELRSVWRESGFAIGPHD
jgi:hypothetical protein